MSCHLIAHTGCATVV